MIVAFVFMNIYDKADQQQLHIQLSRVENNQFQCVQQEYTLLSCENPFMR